MLKECYTKTSILDTTVQYSTVADSGIMLYPKSPNRFPDPIWYLVFGVFAVGVSAIHAWADYNVVHLFPL